MLVVVVMVVVVVVVAAAAVVVVVVVVVAADEVSDHIYVLTPWCRFLLEKLTGLQLVNKFPAFH